MTLLGASIDFAQAGRLAAQPAQVVELGAANVSRTHHFDLVDHFRVQRKDALNAMAEAHLTHREAGLRTFALGDHDAFERLETFLIAFLDFHLNSNRIARLEIGKIGASRLGYKPVNNWR